MKGTVGWMFGAWLGLIALQALTSPSAPTRVSQLFSGAQQFIDRLLNPAVPLIPDLRSTGFAGGGFGGAFPGESTTSTAPTTTAASSSGGLRVMAQPGRPALY